MKKKFLCLILIGLTITMFTVSVNANTAKVPVINSVQILDAYYVDYDIFSIIDITLGSEKNKDNFYLYVVLTDPLGEESDILIRVYSNINKITLFYTFYNHATAPGDYIVTAHLFYNNGGWFAITDVMIFDPPGGSEGDPYIGIKVI